MDRSLSVDSALKLKDRAAQPYVSTRSKKKVASDFLPQQWYRDAKSGLTWYVVLDWLYQYDEGKQTYRSFYLGMNENARAHARIIPYQDEVLVLLDRRMERFDRQGHRISTLAYPRVQPDGIYASTPQGENSWVMDEAAGTIYLVQGYRVLGIDLKRNEARTVFRQSFADIGELLVHKGSIYFLLHSNQMDFDRQGQSNGKEASAKMVTEVVRLGRQTLGLHRYFVRGFYDVLRLDTASGSGEEALPGMVLTGYN
ncbi:hypothetical protein [Paenibacillus sp. R14(2021)]|uniref:hypothetical protein n=1 Tax=Paenibacillus sp. R14(2021) TaxID=2859228 RepID=UPI001C6155E7|nr:hypothetical protein [Paenibacillus sp. R14(2021)]